MSTTITLSHCERNTLFCCYRSSAEDPRLRLRAHLILLLADGRSWTMITTVLYCSTRTIARWKKRFLQDRIEGLLGEDCGPKARLCSSWPAQIAQWIREASPRAFGWLRSRWSCSLIVVLLRDHYHQQVSRETVRLWLHQQNLVWRRPRPVLKRPDPQREAILEQLRRLMRDLPPDETIVFQDEVDLNLNPEIGSCWMERGKQSSVVTPGDNEKCYLAASLHWRSGKLLAPCIGENRNGALVAEHLEELLLKLRRYKKIHVIWDNASFHHRGAAQRLVKKYPERLVVHYLPKYAPECNPVERVWWHLREEITRNHQCGNLDELVTLVFDWIQERKNFKVEDEIYREGLELNDQDKPS